MKKEHSDHIAKTFLEQKSAVKKRDNSFVFYVLLSFGIVFFFVVAVNVFYGGDGQAKIPYLAVGQQLMLRNHEGPYCLEFNFLHTSAKVASLGIDIPEIDLSVYSDLNFSIRLDQVAAQQLGVLKIILENKRNEKSEIYISEVDNQWKNITLLLTDFSSIYDWSTVKRLSFVVEEWNLYPKKGKVFIEEIRFSKKYRPKKEAYDEKFPGLTDHKG